jgi:hypothetical protein
VVPWQMQFQGVERFRCAGAAWPGLGLLGCWLVVGWSVLGEAANGGIGYGRVGIELSFCLGEVSCVVLQRGPH